MKPLRIYISGKISGLNVETAKEYFTAMYQRLQQAGHIPINPFDLLPQQDSYTWTDYMIADIDAIFVCDAMIMLDNWMDSDGARIEHQIAVRRGMQIIYPVEHEKFLAYA